LGTTTASLLSSRSRSAARTMSKSASKIGSSNSLAAVCTTRSRRLHDRLGRSLRDLLRDQLDPILDTCVAVYNLLGARNEYFGRKVNQSGSDLHLEFGSRHRNCKVATLSMPMASFGLLPSCFGPR
jgi:hypothetical protein